MLFCAFEHHHRPYIIRRLLKAGALVNQQSSKDLKTALHIAAHKGALDIVQILLNHKADPTLRDAKGNNCHILDP